MIKLHKVDIYFGHHADYYTCEKNIASMTVMKRRASELTQITTFAGEKVEVSETPEEIFKLLKKDKRGNSTKPT